MKPLKKLKINRETLRNLTNKDLERVVGGRGQTLWCSTMSNLKCFQGPSLRCADTNACGSDCTIG